MNRIARAYPSDAIREAHRILRCWNSLDTLVAPARQHAREQLEGFRVKWPQARAVAA